MKNIFQKKIKIKENPTKQKRKKEYNKSRQNNQSLCKNQVENKAHFTPKLPRQANIVNKAKKNGQNQ